MSWNRIPTSGNKMRRNGRWSGRIPECSLAWDASKSIERVQVNKAKSNWRKLWYHYVATAGLTEAQAKVGGMRSGLLSYP